ncbi:hypothetical protein EU528_09060 [Candidatus Thorarchaeota archaeon]|nr:MAG: hypothetical protein EU528_09060 [Candidatus Thorarchaeota archaeon]
MKSLCPICRRLLETTETIESGNVYIHRTCPEHGTTKTKVSTDADYWTESLKYDRPGSKPCDDQGNPISPHPFLSS